MTLNIASLYNGFGLAFSDVLAIQFVNLVNAGFSPYLLVIPTLLYASNPFLLLEALKTESITIMTMIWGVLGKLIIICLGIYAFKEKVTKYQYAGIILSFISIILLTYGEKELYDF